MIAGGRDSEVQSVDLANIRCKFDEASTSSIDTAHHRIEGVGLVCPGCDACSSSEAHCRSRPPTERPHARCRARHRSLDPLAPGRPPPSSSSETDSLSTCALSLSPTCSAVDCLVGGSSQLRPPYLPNQHRLASEAYSSGAFSGRSEAPQLDLVWRAGGR